MQQPGDLYIDLIKRSLKNIPYLDEERNPIMPRGRLRPTILKAFERCGIGLVHVRPLDLEARLAGSDHTSVAHTMVSMARLDNVEACVRQIVRDDVPGDLIEAGVLRGGTAIFMRAMLRALDDDLRTVWLADSFQGLPAPNPEKYPADRGSDWHEFLGGSVGLAAVRDRFDRYGLLDDRVRFLEGWFKDTLGRAPIQSLSLLRLDGDMYESTMDTLTPLYPKVSVGGFVIVDDWELEPCRLAVEEYRASHGITDEIVGVDSAAVYWRRTQRGGGT